MTSTREDVEFVSRGATLRGWLYRPAGTTNSPGVVMAHGFTAVREMFLDRYAKAFAAAGLTALVYDHYGFGASDGEPRQSPEPSVQRDGYRDAIDWLGHQASIDAGRIGIWGSSYSGEHVVVLSTEDLPIQCAVAQVPGIGASGPDLSEATIAAIDEALEQGRLDDTIPAVSATKDEVGIMSEDTAYDWFMRVSAERAPSWRNEVRIGALTEPTKPIEYLPHVKVPLLLIVAPDDRLVPPGDGMKVAAKVPQIEVVEIPGGHFDAYESSFAESSQPAVAWFKRHLAPLTSLPDATRR